MKVGVLSNINVDSLIKRLNTSGSGVESFLNEGYSNIFGTLLDKSSSFNEFNPSIQFLLFDLAELLRNCITINEAKTEIDNTFNYIAQIIKPETIYFISNGECTAYTVSVLSTLDFNLEVEAYWNSKLTALIRLNSNVFIFNIKSLITKTGRDSFYSNKLWYLGNIRYSSTGEKLLAAHIEECINAAANAPKKVLVVDLDNTLWGGLVGEDAVDGIKLSDSGVGRIYKDFQQVIKRIKDTGVILCIASKNNPEDALSVIQSHPHMILHDEDFIVKKISWDLKSKAISEIADELNLSTDSMVFIDDSPAERQEVAMALSDIIVPDFPAKIELLPQFMEDIYNKYFLKLNVTNEDKNKSEMYQENRKREQLKSDRSYKDYLKELEITVQLMPLDEAAKARVYQLINKTNQFNLTTRRYEQNQLSLMFDSDRYKFYVFNCKDKFGDNGIIAVIIVDFNGETPFIDTFLMSCRVMGRQIENYMIDLVEKDLLDLGYKNIAAKYVYTAKSAPVREFYENLGYEITAQNDKEKQYNINLLNKKPRNYIIR